MYIGAWLSNQAFTALPSIKLKISSYILQWCVCVYLECGHGVRRGKEVVLGLVVLLHEHCQVAHQEISILHVLRGCGFSFNLASRSDGGTYNT